jgi:hypothetical protein
MQGITYAPDVSGVDQTYEPVDTNVTEPDFSTLEPDMDGLPATPSLVDAPTFDPAPTVPAAFSVPGYTERLITTSVFDDIFNRAAAKLARVNVKEERDAYYMASAMGIGMLTPALTIRLQEAQEKANQAVNQAALEESIQEGTTYREDAKALLGFGIQNWPLKPTLDLDSYKAENELTLEAFKGQNETLTTAYAALVGAITQRYSAKVAWVTGYLGAQAQVYASRVDRMRANIGAEAERRAWSELQIKTILDIAENDVKYAIQKAQVLLETVAKAQEVLAQLSVGLAQAMLAAANYNLNGGSNFSYSSSDSTITETIINSSS